MTDASNTPGQSARREYERRKAKDEARLREQWGPLGNIAVGLSGERQSTLAWSTGAAGEERMGRVLNPLASDSIRVLHDRRIPGTRGNIDHIVVTGDAIWVIDAKKYKGRPDLRVEGGFLRPRLELLFVGGRNQTKLVDGVLNQRDKVRAVVGNVPIRPVLCFVEADWPLIGGSFTTRDVAVVWPKKLAEIVRLGQIGRVVDVEAVTALIAKRFPAA